MRSKPMVRIEFAPTNAHTTYQPPTIHCSLVAPMKSGSISSDLQSPEARPAASVDSRYRLDKSSSVGDEDLDMEVNRFLESEFFADHGYALASSAVQPRLLEPSTSNNVPDERMFMDIDESFDMPDLDFGDVSGTFEDSGSSQTGPPSSEAAELRGSLRVHIPASALFGSRQPTPLDQPKKKTPRSTSSTRSKRRREEMAYLRQQVQDFEDKLEQLRQSALKSGGSSPSSCSSSALEVESGTVETIRHSAQWERIAKSQKTEKQKAEAENAKLKKALEGQLKVAKSLSKVLRRNQDISWLESSYPEQTTKNLCTEVTEDADNRFEMLEVEVEALSAQLDSVFDGIGAVDADMEGHSEQVKTDESGNIFMEVVDSTAMPFDVHTVGAAIWKLMSASSLNFGNRQYQTIDASNDTIRAQVSLDMRLQRHETSIQMWVVGKRVVADADRIVFVWSAMGGTECSLFGKDRVKIRESAWTVITAGSGFEENGALEERTSDNQDQREPVAIVQNVVRMTPELQMSGGSSSVSEDHVGVLTDVVLSSFRRNLATMGQMIENIILSDAATTRANE